MSNNSWNIIDHFCIYVFSFMSKLLIILIHNFKIHVSEKLNWTLNVFQNLRMLSVREWKAKNKNIWNLVTAAYRWPKFKNDRENRCVVSMDFVISGKETNCLLHYTQMNFLPLHFHDWSSMDYFPILKSKCLFEHAIPSSFNFISWLLVHCRLFIAYYHAECNRSSCRIEREIAICFVTGSINVNSCNQVGRDAIERGAKLGALAFGFQSHANWF